jgi:hypothetical protein
MVRHNFGHPRGPARADPDCRVMREGAVFHSVRMGAIQWLTGHLRLARARGYAAPTRGKPHLRRLRRRFLPSPMPRSSPKPLTGSRQIAAAGLCPRALRTSLPGDRSSSALRARGSQRKSLFGRTFPTLVRSAEKRLRGVHHEMRSHSMTASLSFRPSKHAPLTQIRCGPSFSASGAVLLPASAGALAELGWEFSR